MRKAWRRMASSNKILVIFNAAQGVQCGVAAALLAHNGAPTWLVGCVSACAALDIGFAPFALWIGREKGD